MTNNSSSTARQWQTSQRKMVGDGRSWKAPISLRLALVLHRCRQKKQEQCCRGEETVGSAKRTAVSISVEGYSACFVSSPRIDTRYRPPSGTLWQKTCHVLKASEQRTSTVTHHTITRAHFQHWQSSAPHPRGISLRSLKLIAPLYRALFVTKGRVPTASGERMWCDRGSSVSLQSGRGRYWLVQEASRVESGVRVFEISCWHSAQRLAPPSPQHQSSSVRPQTRSFCLLLGRWRVLANAKWHCLLVDVTQCIRTCVVV
jgi:hypothetical protein